MAKNIAGLICAFNEEKTIYEVASRTKNFVNRVYVIEDGSTDGTVKEAKRAGVEVIRHSMNWGKGAAFKTGFANLKGTEHDAVVVLDADLQHLPEEIPRFIEKFEEGYNVVIGKRDFNNPNVPRSRRMGNNLYSTLLSSITGQKIYDPECGFRLYKVDLLDRLINLSDLNGFNYESEVIKELAKAQVEIGWADISTVYIPGRVSKIKPLRHLLGCAMVCLKA